MTMRHAAGGAGPIDEPQRSPDEEPFEDTAGRGQASAEGTTGSVWVTSEHEADAAEERRQDAESGAVAGAIAGTSALGPLGGTLGAAAGGTAGADMSDETRDRPSRDEDRDRGAG